MTTQHTIESTTEYTPEEQIAALRKLGAEIENNDALYRIRLLGLHYYGSEDEALHLAHEYLRTDESAWMKMDEVLKKSCLWRRLAGYVMGEVDIYDYQVMTYPGKHFQSGGEDRQTAVYPVFMQHIRMELKKK